MARLRVGLVTGGFDPIHAGHVALIEEAWRAVSILFVGVNSDEWLIEKKGYRLLPASHRVAVLDSFGAVHKAFAFETADGTAVPALSFVRSEMRSIGLGYEDYSLVFMNGGDRDSGNVPEAEIREADEVAFGIGGRSKMGSSSDFVTEAFLSMKPTSKVS